MLGSKIQNTPILSLQTGLKTGSTTEPIIDPSTLTIVAYQVKSSIPGKDGLYLRIQDIREISELGFIIDNDDELVAQADVIKIDELIKLNFRLVGLEVLEEKSNKKLGKVDDYNVEIDSFVIQQINVKRGMLKSLGEANLLIGRSQIVEVTDHYIKVKNTMNKSSITDSPVRPAYTNPFRASRPQTN